MKIYVLIEDCEGAGAPVASAYATRELAEKARHDSIEEHWGFARERDEDWPEAMPDDDEAEEILMENHDKYLRVQVDECEVATA